METETHDVLGRLHQAGIPITQQRIRIAEVLLKKPVHMAADQVWVDARQSMPEISRATVYNTLKLFCEKQLIKELVVDPERIFYDSNTAPHFHLYNTTTGQLSDIPMDELQISGIPNLPPGTRLEQIDVIARVANFD